MSNRDQRSVPTRRSSDLLRFGSGNFEADMDVYNLMNSNTVYGVRTTTGTIGVRQAGDPAGTLKDRKSTRLTSSNQIISYAVFCLKKKKHKGKTRNAQRLG